MEDVKKYEAAVIRRACYMVNAYLINEGEFTKSFYFTNSRSFDKWYEQNPCSSWILTSFYKAYLLLLEKRGKDKNRKEKIEKEFLIPACSAINAVIDSQNQRVRNFTAIALLLNN